MIELLVEKESWIMVDTNECFQRDIYCDPMLMREQMHQRCLDTIPGLKEVEEVLLFFFKKN